MYDPDGRIKRIAPGVLLPPGMCCVCSTTSGELYADLDVQIDWFGSLYLCEACAFSACEVFGGLRPVSESALKEQIRSLEESLRDMVEKNESLEKLSESYRTTILDLSRNPGRSDDSPSGTPDVQTSGERSESPVIIGAEPLRDSEPVSNSESGSSTGDDEIDAEIDVDDEPDNLSKLFEAVAESAGAFGESSFEQRSTPSKGHGRLFGE